MAKRHLLGAGVLAFGSLSVFTFGLAQPAAPVAASGGRGIEVSDMRPGRRAVHRLLRVRQRRLARGEPDSRLHAALEPPLGGGRVQQGPAQDDPGRGRGRGSE